MKIIVTIIRSRATKDTEGLRDGIRNKLDRSGVGRRWRGCGWVSRRARDIKNINKGDGENMVLISLQQRKLASSEVHACECVLVSACV